MNKALAGFKEKEQPLDWGPESNYTTAPKMAQTSRRGLDL